MKVRVVFFEEKDIFGKMKVKVVGFYAELQTFKVTLSVLSATRTAGLATKMKMCKNLSTSKDSYCLWNTEQVSSNIPSTLCAK